jgi:hypothetical protein
VGTGRGGTKLHASVAGSRVTAFLATAAPWEPYFTDNPHTFLQMIIYGEVSKNYKRAGHPFLCVISSSIVNPPMKVSFGSGGFEHLTDII